MDDTSYFLKNINFIWILLMLAASSQVAHSQGFVSPVFMFDTKAPVVSLQGPNGGEVVNYTAPLLVTWTATDDNLRTNPITIQLIVQPGNNVYTLAQNRDNMGTASVNLPASITTQAKIKVLAKDMFGNEGIDESNSYFTITSGNLTANFIANPTSVNINVPIQFTDSSVGSPKPTSWSWDFGDGKPASSLQNPLHSYEKAGLYTVKLTVSNGIGLTTKTKPDYIDVNSLNNGIDLQIVETGDQNVVKWIGYQYRTLGGLLLNTVYIPVVNHTAQITWDNKILWDNDFNDEIILYKEENGLKKQVGHIKFEYEHSIEKKFTRNAILIFHNDQGMKPNFPYEPGTPEYDWQWDYYHIGEYPVSMLIPPDNSFPAVYDNKQPLLFVHGWGGTFSYSKNPDAIPEHNEVSGWFTTVKKVNEYVNFQAWQFYYPYDTDIPVLGKCLKAAIGNLKLKYSNYKIGIITHSMGGLVTSEYITSNPTDAHDNVLKVLYSVPPIHGSIGANKHYKRDIGYIVELNDNTHDRNAPAPRDMALGSKFMWDLHNRDWVNLNGDNENGIEDDYFVLIGTIKDFFGPSQYIHNESRDHNDGIVSISSASLTDKGIGFASFHGNHFDGSHAQSKIRNNYPDEQNIGDELFIPEIIKSYFTKNHSDFIDEIKQMQHVEAVVTGAREIVKPQGQNWNNISTSEDVNYKKGILNFRLLPPYYFQWGWPNFLFAYYNQSTSSIIASRLPKILSGYECIGAFLRNSNVNSYPSYFFSAYPALFDECTINFADGTNYLSIYDLSRLIVNNDSLELKYSQTTMVTFGQPSRYEIDLYRDQSDLKTDSVLSQQGNPIDSIHSSFFINSEDTVAKFVCTLPTDISSGSQIKLKSPDGIVYDSTFSEGTYEFNAELGEYAISIPDPTPGKWYAWMESNLTGADTISYNAVAYMQSDLHAFIADTTETVPTGKDYRLAVGLQMNSPNLADSMVVKATIFNPNGTSQILGLSANPILTDTSMVFWYNFPVDSIGDYIVKYNFDGVYNGYRFERVLFQQFEAIDTIPFMQLSDVQLRQSEQSLEINLENLTYNLNSIDTLVYSAEVLSSNVDTSNFKYYFDSTSSKVFMNSNLSDTGTVIMRYNCAFKNQVLSDTMSVTILLPDLSFASTHIADTMINSGTTRILNYSLINTGNTYTGAYDVRYYVSEDTLLQSTDLCIGSKTILHHEADSILIISDTLQIPLLNLVGNFYLLIEADAGKSIIEINEDNNIEVMDVFVNGTPAKPFLASAIPANSAVHLTWQLKEPGDITGFIIYYDTDTIAPFNGVHTESGQSSPIILQGQDTSCIVSGLYNDTTYYFSITTYNAFGNESMHSNFVSAIPYAIPTSINLTITERSFFRIYPNPTAEKITIVITDEIGTSIANIHILNMFGTEVLNDAMIGSGSKELSLQHLTKGIYIIQIITGDQVGTIKIIKQ